VQYENIGIVIPVNKQYVCGLHFSSLKAPELAEKNIYGAKTGKSFKFNNSRLTLSCSKRLLNNLGLGINLKSIAETIHDYNSNTLCGDIGFYYEPGDFTVLGASCENIAGKSKLKNMEHKLPLIIKFGGRRNIINDTLLLSFTGTIEESSRFYYGLGAEYNFYNISVRTGFNSKILMEKSGSGITCGFGLNYKKFIIDYAFVPYNALGQIHYITFSFDFKSL